jgi:multiple sugar transport system ATP-binding protein
MPRAAVPQFKDVATFQVCITQVEFLGSEWLAYGTVDGEFGNAKVLCKLREEAIGKVKVGEVQEFVVPRAQLRFFDKETGRRTAPMPV